jgi:hypothetical protein
MPAVSLLLALVGAHGAAALRHRFVQSNGVLAGRRLPGVRRTPRPAGPGAAAVVR